MKHYLLNFMVIVLLASGCRKEIKEIPAPPDPEAGYTNPTDPLTSNKWVFTEYHDRVAFPKSFDSSVSDTYTMYMISGGYENARINMDGKILLNRTDDFKFEPVDYFRPPFPKGSFVNNFYSGAYQDTANYTLIEKSFIILSKPVKYLPDTMSIALVDTACLILSGTLHIKDYDVKRTIVFYKNTRWYGGYRNLSQY